MITDISFIFVVFPGVVVGVLAGLTGWQVNLVAIHRGMKYNPASTFSTGMGATIADFILILMAFTSGSFFLGYFKSHIFFRWIGGVMLFLIAFHMFFTDLNKIAANEPNGRSGGFFRSFLIGLGMVAGNPLIFVMWFGVVSALLGHFPALKELIPRFLFTAGFVLGSLAWFVCLAHGSRKIIKGREYKLLTLYTRISAVLLLILAVFIMLKEVL